MPARPQTNIQLVCAAAAVVTYVECSKTGNLVPLATGMQPKAGQLVHLTVHAN
jgi:hypothetical protein